MAGLQRFITYINKYENDEKMENAGFAKIEIRGNVCRVEVHIRNISTDQPKATVYLYAKENENIQGIPLGSIEISRGNGDVRFAFDTKELFDFGKTMRDMEGIFILYGEAVKDTVLSSGSINETSYLASQWKEGTIELRRFRIMEKKKPQEPAAQKPDKTQSPQSETNNEKNANADKTISENSEENTASAVGQSGSKEPEANPRQTNGFPIGGPQQNNMRARNNMQRIRQTGNNRQGMLPPDKDWPDSRQTENNRQEFLQSNRQEPMQPENQGPEPMRPENSQQEMMPLGNQGPEPMQSENQEPEPMQTGSNRPESIQPGNTQQQSMQPANSQQQSMQPENPQQQTKQLENIRQESLPQEERKNVVSQSENPNASNEPYKSESVQRRAANMPNRPFQRRSCPFRGRRNIRATELPMEEFFEESGWERMFQKLRLKLDIFFPFEGQEIECVRMQLNDLQEFPKKYWYLANNSFLLHGFFNYKHIIFGERKEDGKKEYFIGVPGVFQNQERIMASMFGFPEFCTAKNVEYKTGNFGYWYRIL